MKNLIILVSFVVINLVSTLKAQTPMTQEQYDNSLAIFEAGKKKYHNCYEFAFHTVHFNDRWSKTFFVVENGKVVERSYVKGDYSDENNKQTEKLMWVERDTALGSHSEGHKIMSMDNLYKIGKSSIGVPPTEVVSLPAVDSSDLEPTTFTIFHYYKFDNQGILCTIGHQHASCLDDCFEGYHMTDFKWGKLSTNSKRKFRKRQK